MRRLVSGIMLALLLICTSNLTLNQKNYIHAAFPTSPSRVYLDPNSYIFNTSTATVGTLFNLTVKVDNVVDMKAWQVKMSYNVSMINVTRWYEPITNTSYVFYGLGGTLPIPAPPKTAYGIVSGDTAWLGVGSTLFPAPSPGGGFTGNGLLGIFTFKITALPLPGQNYTCNFDINYPTSTFWINASSTAKTQFDIYENGYYELKNSSTRIYVVPSSCNFDALTAPVGTLFNLTVKVDNVVDMQAWQVKMGFNDSFVNVTRWYEPTWDPAYVFYGKGTLPVPVPPEVVYNPGWLGVGAAMFPAPSPGEGFTGNGLLCIFTFNITATPPPDQNYTCNFDISYPTSTFWIKTGESTERQFDIYENGYYECKGGPIIPEFPSFFVLPLFMLATLLAVIVYRRKQERHTTLYLP